MQQQEEQQQEQQQQQQQQHQSHPTMQSYYSNNITTDHIQQYLDENKALILKIVESQNLGKVGECAENQARLQRNLMYLAAIADSQPQPPTMHSQFSPSGTMQAAGSSHYMQQQQQLNQNMMTPQALMAARSSMLYSQPPFSSLQQHQQQHQQQQTLHSQLAGGIGSSGLNQMMQSDQATSGSLGGFPDFFRANKQDHIGGSDGRGGSSSGGDGSEALYLKSAEDGIN